MGFKSRMSRAKSAIFQLNAWVNVFLLSSLVTSQWERKYMYVCCAIANMSVSSVNSTNYEGSLDSREGSDDDRRENEDKDTEVSLQTLGMAPYLFEPVAPANEYSPSDRSDEDDEGPVWRLNNTNWYVTVSSTEIILLYPVLCM